jgi:hypothetical protein
MFCEAGGERKARRRTNERWGKKVAPSPGATDMLLLRAGADPNIADEEGFMLLMSAKLWKEKSCAPALRLWCRLCLHRTARSASESMKPDLYRAMCGVCLLFAFYPNSGARTRLLGRQSGFARK